MHFLDAEEGDLRVGLVPPLYPAELQAGEGDEEEEEGSS